MIVVTCKYYSIYMTYPLGINGHTNPLAGSSRSWEACHRVPNLVNGPNICDMVVLMGRAQESKLVHGIPQVVNPDRSNDEQLRFNEANQYEVF
jgi:hypothetical protein